MRCKGQWYGKTQIPRKHTPQNSSILIAMNVAARKGRRSNSKCMHTLCSLQLHYANFEIQTTYRIVSGHSPNSKMRTSLCLNSRVHNCPMTSELWCWPHSLITGSPKQHGNTEGLQQSRHRYTISDTDMTHTHTHTPARAVIVPDSSNCIWAPTRKHSPTMVCCGCRHSSQPVVWAGRQACQREYTVGYYSL